MKNVPEVSILIAVYNTSAYLKECLDHALGQTLQNIEVICVNDCSTDDSLAILSAYAEKDTRLKVINLPENKGRHLVRQILVKEAKGKYILFCDADDYLEKTAAERSSHIIENQACDAVLFNCRVFGGTETECISYTKKYNHDQCQKLAKDDFIRYYFSGNIEKPNALWRWLFKTNQLQAAYKQFPEVRINYFEDAFVLPVILTYCKSIFMTTDILYHYRRGCMGITSDLSFDTNQKKILDFLTVQDFFEGVFQKRVKFFPKSVINDFLSLRHTTIHSAIMHFIFQPHYSVKEAAQLLRLYSSRIPAETLCKWVIFKYTNCSDQNKFLQIVGKSGIIPTLRFNSFAIKTVAISYERFTVGGVERYMQHVINLFIQMGMKVVLLTTERNPEHDLALPPGVPHYELGRDVLTRAERLSEVIEKEKIDLYYEQNFSAVSDLMVCKLRYNLPVIAHWHTAFSYYMRNGSDYGWSLCLQHRFYDLTLCLSDIAAMFFRTNGVKAKYLMNIQGFTADCVPAHPGNRPLKTILWLARLDAGVKQPRAAVQIMQEVVKTIPDAKMLIVGGPTPWNPNEPEFLAKMIREAGLENNVTLCGEQLDVESYYRKADVFLMTSTVEGLPNTIYEASAHGLPVVMYDLPYLAYHSYPENGIVSVPMNDKNAAAEAICRILQNEDEHRELSASSRKMAEDISAIDFEQEWREIFAALERGGEKFLYIGEEHQGALRVMMETLREHTLLGVNTKFRNLNDEIARLKKNQASWLVRKFRGGIQCLKDNGFRYTVKRIFEKVKGKLSRRKGAA